ncbi:MAG: carbohydrate ABC transporter permease [Chloroflexi bacterium]|nr:carbohydrate ABC transporter permease [Chloroflexota bacterium]
MPSPHLLNRLLAHLTLALLTFISLFPIYWMVVTSFRPENEIYATTLLPQHPSLEHYQFAWSNIPLGQMLVNTALMATLVTLGHLLISLLAGYSLARWEYPGNRLLFFLFLGTWLIPFQVTMVPNYVLLSRLNWLNTLPGLVVPQLATALGIILMRQHLKAFPRELFDAAMIDGAGSWRTLWQVAVPNLRAPLAALAILYFINGWNEYFWPLLVTRRPENSVVQVGLQMFLTQEGSQWGALMAAATLASLPIFALYLVLQRHVIEAFLRSGLK